MATYSARRSAFEADSEFTLTEDALVRTVNGAEAQRITLAGVRRVLINRSGAGSNYARPIPYWICSVQGVGGQIRVPSATFTGPGSLHDQSPAFRPFVEAVTHAVAAKSPGAAFVSHVWARGIQALLIVLWLVLGLVTAFSVLTGLGLVLFILADIILAVITGVCWWIWRANLTGRFDPAALPPDIAPSR